LGQSTHSLVTSTACISATTLALAHSFASRSFYTMTHELSQSSFVMERATLFSSPKIEFAMKVPPVRQTFPREIVFLGGAPGAGKGTNSSYLARLRGFNAPTIVVSDLLNTPSCKLSKDHGVMVDDAYVFNALSRELEKPIYRNGVVVDGFPRTAKQAGYLTNFYNQIHSQMRTSLAPTRMLFVMLHIDETASINRQQARGRETVMLNEERVQKDMPLLEVRVTDTHIESSRARYAVYNEQMSAVMGLKDRFPLVVVDASATIDAVRANIANKMATLP